jgi:FtsP/CotA-like multicopper oxidase with cupredoxin domain
MSDYARYDRHLLGIFTIAQTMPGNSFEYAFNASGQSGTFWYHSDYMTQSCDGLRGPLVIYDPYVQSRTSIFAVYLTCEPL